MIYNVGPTQAYTTIDAAIQQAIADNPTGTLTQDVTIRVIESGVFGPIVVPAASLNGSPSAKLTIEAPNQVLGKVQSNGDGSETAISIGAGNSYVCIRGFTIESFVNGIVTGDNCHNTTVEKCVIANASNAGIWFYQSDNCHAVNNVIFQTKYGILTTLVKNVAVVYNTIALPTSSPAGGACLSISLQEDRGAQDHGTAVIYNNILTTASSVAIELHERDLSHLDSNNNNIHSLNGTVARKFSTLPGGTVSESLIYVVANWRVETSQDGASISDNPTFVRVAGTLASFDLSLLDNSPCIAAGANVGSGVTLPSFVNTTILGDDILYQTRSTTPTIGANEVAADSSLFNLDIFGAENPISNTCGSATGAIEAAITQYASTINFWRPEVKSGHFFVRDKDYYLYSEKGAYTLGNISRTKIKLPAPILRNTVKVFVSGVEVTDEKYWEIAGTTFYLNHLDLAISSDNDGIIVEGQVRSWDDASQSFVLGNLRVQRQLKDGKRTYWLPKNPVDSAPIVMTDDTVQLLDPEHMLPQEFSTHYDSTQDKTEIRFAHGENLIQNPQFDYGIDVTETETSLEANGDDYVVVTNPIRRFQDSTDNVSDLGTDLATTANAMCDFRINEEFLARVTSGGQNFLHAGAELPQDWQTTTDGRMALRQFVQWGDNRTVRPRMGRQMLVIDIPDTASESHNIAQDLRVDDEQSYYLSLFAAAPSGSGSFWVKLDFVDHNGVSVGTSGTLTQAVTTTNLSADDTGEYWQRFGLPIGLADNRNNVAASGITELQTTPVSIPADAYRMTVSVGATQGTPIAIDCLQLEGDSTHGAYRRVPRGADMTVEYEESDKGFYVVKDLTVSPFKNPKTTGFLTIAPVAAGQFDLTAPINSTTLNDWCWANGRLNYMPWARLYGKNKLKRASWERSEYAGLTTLSTSWDEDVRGPLTILTQPEVVSAVQGDLNEGFAVEVFDTDNNPYAHNSVIVEAIEAQAQFPGYIGAQDYGLPVTLAQATSVSLNEKGVMTLYYTPPTAAQVEYRGNKPTLESMSTPSGARNIGTITTPYEVNKDNHGNVTLQDGLGTMISLNDTAVQEAILEPGTSEGGFTRYDIGDYAVNGTLKAFIADSAGNFTAELQQSGSRNVSSFEYYLDLENAYLIVGSNSAGQIKVTYNRRLAWKNPNNPREIVMDNAALSQVSGDIVVNYDAAVVIKVTAEAPARTAGVPAIFKEIKAIATNPHAEQVAV